MARRKVQPGASYAGRRTDATVVNVTMDTAAATLLRQYASGKKLGAFVSKLVYDYDVKQIERARLREQIAQVFAEEE
jgi:hypothetical protein